MSVEIAITFVSKIAKSMELELEMIEGGVNRIQKLPSNTFPSTCMAFRAGKEAN